MTPVEQAFASLTAHRVRLESHPMRDLFGADPERFARFSESAAGITLDFSKNRIDAAAFNALIELARVANVEQRRAAMWAGEHINATEDRAVLHMALRHRGETPVNVDGKDVMPDVHAVLGQIETFVGKVRNREMVGATGLPFTAIVNIGIGGSDLGPAMVVRALEPYTRDDLRAHFISNVDGADAADTLKRLDPATTLFVIASKTFTTDETMTNAATARKWIADALGEKAVPHHFAAVSTNLEACAKFGIRSDQIFGFWDWVGGRYSVWSAIGLPIALAIGYDRFAEFLDGAAAMDRHFREAPLGESLPVIMAVLGIWYRNVWGFGSHAVLPYDQRLSRFPAYLQQQDMESNGKSVTLEGKPVVRATGPVIWGEPGTNGQHAFFQLIHQGTDIVPCDFLIAATPQEDMPPHHAKLIANCLAQSEALMRGKTEAEVRAELKAAGMAKAAIDALVPHKVFPGNRPSNTLVYKQLDPFTLGALIALYEHKVFVQGTIWHINSFDQWGVELGKQLAKALLPKVTGKDAATGHDSSTLGLIETIRDLRS